MLEGLVANLLNRFLGMYVRNFDPKQLNVGIWNGDVKLRDLELKREALDQFKLPINVVKGHLGQLTMAIPWTNLRGKPVRINIEDVFLLAAPKEDEDYDAEEEERRAHAVKMEKLESAELLKERSTEGMSPEEQRKNQSFTQSLVTAIVDNVQISIKNIHIRYEDSISDPGHPFAAGITLREFSAVSTDEGWRPTFVTGGSSTHKLANLGAFAFYWDTDTTLIGTGKGSDEPDQTKDVILEKFREMIVKAEDQTVPGHQYILKPVTGRAGLEMDKTGRTDRAKLKASLPFEELGFVIDEDQYRDALMLVDLFHYFIRHQEHKKLQPKKAPKEDPRAWVIFAGRAILNKIHERNRKWSWSYFKERRDDRTRYIQLFKKKKKEEKLTPEETQDLDRLETKLSYEDLRFWRSLARNQLRKEDAGVKKPAQKQTWSSWIWGGGKKGEQQQQHQDDTEMTEQQRKELYDAIDFDEKQQLVEAIDMPRDAVKMQINMSLKTGSFTLKRDPHGKATEILRLLFDSFSTKVVQRPDSFLTDLSLQGIRLFDGTTEGSLFPQMIMVKETSRGNEDAGEHPNTEAPQSPRTAADTIGDAESEPFFQMSFEQNPLDGSADTALSVKLRGMEVVYNPRFVVEVAKFFKPPERHMESIGALMETAGATVEGFRQQTRAGLEFALQEHKTVNAQLDLQAPLIIIPDSVTQESTLCLILDAGHASFNSQLADKATIQEVEKKQKQQYTEEDHKQLQSLMYDKFSLRLDNTQLLIGTTIEETKAQLAVRDSAKNFHVVDRINMDFLIETCILPKATDLTKLRISGHLPVLHASVSDTKYKGLMRMLDVAVPKFDNASPDAEVSAEKRGSHLPRSQSGNTSELPGTDRAKSFQVSSQEHELIVEEESIDERDGNLQDANGGKQKPEINMWQRNVEFKFTVDKLQGSLYRSNPEEGRPDTLLAELIAELFYLEFYQRPFDMVAEVRLRKLAIEDHVEENPTSEFKNIIFSEDLFSASKGQKELFQLKFVKVSQEHPEFTSTYEGFGTDLDVAISTINFVITRKTLLTLLDFVLVTFTNSDSSAPEPKSSEDGPKPDPEERSSPGQGQQQDTDKIRIKVQLKRIAVILNNDGIRLATLSLNSADVHLLLLGKVMRLNARLGNLSLLDDVNQGVPEASALRQLITIQGDELADFSYETFDADSQAYPGHDTAIRLRSGSLQVNFVTEPFRKIMDFAVKFGKMQAVFNAARQAAASQANQIQERGSKMKFDILVKTPIVVFPRMSLLESRPHRDMLTAYLGEIYASNSFVPLDDSKNAGTANKLNTGIRNIRLTSKLNYAEGTTEELEMIEKVDLDFKITSAEHKPRRNMPDTEIEGNMSDINLKITQMQLKFMLELSRSIPAAFATEPEELVEEEVQNELPKSAVEPAKSVMQREASSTRSQQDQQEAHSGSELAKDSEQWTKLDLVFKCGAIGLELIRGSEDSPVGDAEKASLSKFAFNKLSVKLKMISDDSLEAELLVQSFTIKDSRTKETNKFRKIMSLINTDVKQQFMASVSVSGGRERNLIALLTVDSPRIILALDYLFAVQSFVNEGLATDEPLAIEDEDDEDAAVDGHESLSSDQSEVLTRKRIAEAGEPDKTDDDGSLSISYRINVVNAQVVLIANPAITNSEAIVLGTQQVLVSSQHVMTLQVDKVGMFLCRMDKFEANPLRILDDFSIQTSLDMRSKNGKSNLVSIEVGIEPLVLRLSLRDILLVMQIVNRASAMTGSQDANAAEIEEPQRIKEITGTDAKSRRKAVSQKPTSTMKKTTKSVKTQTRVVPQEQAVQPQNSAVIKSEEMKVRMDGIRVVLIGDLHELPMVDWSVRRFDVEVKDWSGGMTADTTIDTFINIYNFSKSAWEPLIEPWQLGFHVSKDQNPDRLSVELYSRKSLELTMTAATIALASKSAQFLSSEEDVLSKPRGVDAPYRIRNYTGFKVDVWAESNDEGGAAAKLDDGEEVPWRFEDASTTRETLSPEGQSGIIGIRLEGSGFDTIDRVPVNREGEALYNLKPKKDNIQHRLLVEVSLGTDNVKRITIRSPLLVENKTQIPIELGIFSPEERHLVKIDKIEPGGAKPAPVGAAFTYSMLVRPDEGFGYTWSSERLFWKDLLKRKTRTITCKGEQNGKSPPFYFQSQAIFDENDPLTGVYPYMRIRLCAPVELQNLLPYDFKYRIYDKNTKKDWTNFLRRGGISPVHVVELSHLLLMSVDLQDTPFKPSEFAIINGSEREEFGREKTLVVKDKNNLELRLKLHY